MTKIEFEFDGDKVEIEPNIRISTLKVGNYFKGTFTYTPSKFRINPPGKLSKGLIQEIDRVIEKWHEQSDRISLDTHIKSRDKVKKYMRILGRQNLKIRFYKQF